MIVRLTISLVLLLAMCRASIASPPVYYSMSVNVEGQVVELVRMGNTYEYQCPGSSLTYDGTGWVLTFGAREFEGQIDQTSGCGVFSEVDGSGVAIVGPCVRSWLYESAANASLVAWGISTMLLVEFFVFLLRGVASPITALRKVL